MNFITLLAIAAAALPSAGAADTHCVAVDPMVNRIATVNTNGTVQVARYKDRGDRIVFSKRVNSTAVKLVTTQKGQAVRVACD